MEFNPLSPLSALNPCKEIRSLRSIVIAIYSKDRRRFQPLTADDATPQQGLWLNSRPFLCRRCCAQFKKRFLFTSSHVRDLIMMGSRCAQLDSHTAGASAQRSPSFGCIVLQFTCYSSFYHRCSALGTEAASFVITGQISVLPRDYSPPGKVFVLNQLVGNDASETAIATWALALLLFWIICEKCPKLDTNEIVFLKLKSLNIA